ncbi:DNA-binding transcriptional activator of the SARP family [Sanguibacter gelidistatuariae]|uniref:DNA-binding transcriptional activator of the SARP family n=1 Tax=Sanguibacter gelidistatuariae TaxID=1814289 RepID=A0A1G6S3R2_9MICO|nr:BTAD domain-containing putative transcriptional regulator [Sanguibacter gelidistatuariae]SDD11552.1 DNA-binding transcriptional activator of the SARP family [Sanguibacter gelidistatuariae]
MAVTLGVLGPVTAWDEAGERISLRGPKHRSVLARLVVAGGRTVPLSMLVDDLWVAPPAHAVGAIRTFVGDLRRALEPDRPPRAPAMLIVTDGTGYALRTDPSSLDASRFERAVRAARTLSPGDAQSTLREALAWWRGPAYADLADEHWARAERSRLTELRLHAVELLAASLLDLGRAADAVPDLDAHVAEHPWREEGWRLLALALYRTGRQGEALDVLRRARTLLVDQLGVDPGSALRRLEVDVLNHADYLDLHPWPDDGAGLVWAEAAATYERSTGPGDTTPGVRSRLRSTVDLLRSLAITGGTGLEAARRQRLATILAAEELGDITLTARVIGAYDVPAIWTRSDDAEQAEQVVAAAERTLAALPSGQDASRARLLATIAIESRGTTEPRGRSAATEAEALARHLDDPALLAFALNGVFMQTFHRAGLAARRDAIGAELVALSSRHDLTTYELLGHLIQLQSQCALGDLDRADAHARAADDLAAEYESPLVAVFTGWYRALRLALTAQPATDVAQSYRAAAAALEGAGMPGLEHGLLPLALLTLRLQHDRPVPTDPSIQWGPYEPWVRPLILLTQNLPDDAARALRDLSDPPPGHLLEALWCLVARAAINLDDHHTMRRALAALSPAAGELAGAGSGLLTCGPTSGWLADLRLALAR